MAFDEFTAATLSQLVDTVLAIRERLAPDAFLWFRGIDCDEHQLLPKIMREGKTAEQIFERELRLLTRFRQRGLAYWAAGYPQSDWEQLFAMQHYGLPTRLLDWTENLFVAAHFALSTATRHQHGETPCVPAIWCMEPVAWNRNMPGPSEFGPATHVFTTVDEQIEAYQPVTSRRRTKSPVALFGAHNTQRIIAQRGTFVIWGNDVNPLEHFAQNLNPTLLWRIRLTGSPEELYKNLQTLGFGETMVFPELPSLAVELSRTEGWR